MRYNSNRGGRRNDQLKYTFKTDMLFKMLFMQYPDLLKKLVAELLGIAPDMIGDKSCRLDINMTVCLVPGSGRRPVPGSRQVLPLQTEPGTSRYAAGARHRLPKEVSRKNMLLLWLSLFKADTKEELDKIKAMGVPDMEQAINAYYTITASSEFHERERLRYL